MLESAPQIANLFSGAFDTLQDLAGPDGPADQVKATLEEAVERALEKLQSQGSLASDLGTQVFEQVREELMGQANSLLEGLGGAASSQVEAVLNEALETAGGLLDMAGLDSGVAGDVMDMLGQLDAFSLAKPVAELVSTIFRA
ncbi:hypothetical protein DL240_09485 [Lujinxingia litoralis]|uniref:Uncharacterized protein n=1 Tax=Lujinxingia litoralis TaxID=2211119 RepID=A0A328C916_9DELT|nr:hypothetical protein DL240_09485 [Lujinxingia litoralis]